MLKFAAALLAAVAFAAPGPSPVTFRGRGMGVRRRRVAGTESRIKANDVDIIGVDFRKLNPREASGLNKAARDW